MAIRIMSGTQNPPSRYSGKDGDFYVNTKDWTLFGPKKGGRWPPGRPIWPSGVPTPAHNLADDIALTAGDGVTLSTNSGAVLFGDMPPPR